MVDVHTLDTLTVGDLILSVAPPTELTTLEITVDRNAALILRAPSGVSRERAELFVGSKRAWVYRKLAEKDALVGPPVVKQFVDGEGFAYLGRSYRLKLATVCALTEAASSCRQTWPSKAPQRCDAGTGRPALRGYNDELHPGSLVSAGTPSTSR